jgi:hypothetical protein
MFKGYKGARERVGFLGMRECGGLAVLYLRLHFTKMGLYTLFYGY